MLPVLFLAGLIQRSLAFRRRQVDMDGDPPIPKALFASSKWAIVLAEEAQLRHAFGEEYRTYCGRVRRYL